MYLRRSTVVKYLIAACIGAPLYCEWLVYVMQPLYWSRLQCELEHTCVKVLFIADPQLEGEYSEPWPLNQLFIWDADRYLKNTFSVVYGYFKPDVMVYLGDLTDEGSVTVMPLLHKYWKRLNDIFHVDSHIVQVWETGDNDIGGEFEPIRPKKVAEFEKLFNQESVVTYSNVSFYKVNAITHTYPKDEPDKTSQYRIVVSHYPITLRRIGHEVHDVIKPNIYFCGHDHVSKFVKQALDLSHRETHLLSEPGSVVTVPGHKDLYEVYVPTCSYRMGTQNIGYGAAIIDKTTLELQYTVYWSPRRFPYLALYACLLAAGLLYCLLYCAARLRAASPCARRDTSAARLQDKVPLLDRV